MLFRVSLFMVIAGACLGQPAGTIEARVAAIVSANVKHGGAAVAVIQRGKVVLAKGFGMADIAASRAITRRTVFDLASLGKQFTGMAVLRLAGRGSLSLDDDIRKHVPEVPVFDPKRPIRIRDLAGHTSGLPQLPPGDGTRPTVASILGWLAKQNRLEYPTGEGWAYSNLGYILLAVAVERAGGRAFGAYLRDEVLKPAGMTHAVFLERPDQPIPERAQGYCLGGKPCRWDDCIPGSANVFASLDEMIAWDRALAQHRLVPEQTWRDVMPCSMGYAFGWGVKRRRGRRVEWHDGDWIGASAYIARYGDDELCTIVLSNAARTPAEEMENAISDLFLDSHPGGPRK